MKGHFGAVLTSGLAAIAIALVLLQVFVVSRSHLRGEQVSAAPPHPTNRYSAPGGRSGIPWLPFDHRPPPAEEGRTQPPPKQEERRAPTPPPARNHSYPPRIGPTPPRRATA
jgi:hypothetical protein